ncbi:MAG: hypothetical protein HUJ30_02410 [Gammaproteobacteria bacterium]|nr:hypothetical protein [Gammaproteobacteria bacterium]
MSLQGFVDELPNVLSADAGLTSWRTTHFDGKAFTVLKGNRELSTFNARQAPAIIIEAEPGDIADTVGNYRANFSGSVAFVIAWVDSDPDKAYTRRITLPELVANAVINNRRLNGAVEKAMVRRYEPLDGNSSAPNVRMMRFTVNANWKVDKT